MARPARPVALLAGEPAGTLAPSVAGRAGFEATLSWRSPDDVPGEPALAVPSGGPARFSLTEVDDAAARRLCGEVTALSRVDLGVALEALLREVTTFAALTEATLEVSAVRAVPPRVASPRALERLALDLWEAGFSVRFESSWTPAPRAEVYLGVDGSEDLRGFLLSHPSWSPA